MPPSVLGSTDVAETSLVEDAVCEIAELDVALLPVDGRLETGKGGCMTRCCVRPGVRAGGCG